VESDKDWRFNHYNMNNNMLKNLVNGACPYKEAKVSYDNSGRRYDKMMDQICQDQCSESFSTPC
jgi:hypothetical protein